MQYEDKKPANRSQSIKTFPAAGYEGAVSGDDFSVMNVGHVFKEIWCQLS